MGGLAKGLKVIEAFTADRPKLSISDAAGITGYDRATTRRCLLTLADLGYCAYDGKYFTVTPRILRLGTGCLAAMPLPRLVQPYLDELSEQIGQSTSVSILDGAEIVYVARAAQQRVMSVTLMPGSRLPAYCTSMGRVLLAALPEPEARDILSSAPLVARTPATRTAVADVLKELEDVRQLGYAVIDQEVELGLRSLAVPLTDFRRQTVAALNVGFAATPEPVDHAVTALLPALKAVQAEISGTLR
jgi:IclR family pca regulon transcriptional regulator